VPETLAQLRGALAGRYEIERELGRGGWATVYLAHDVRHDRPVALKVLRRDLAASLGPGRFLREIAIAGRLTHPHILPVYDSGEAADSLYYVMPYVEGQTLRRRLEREGQLPVADTLAIARQVADALTFAHTHNVVHRDIKPENILLEAGDQAYLADFGIARAILIAAGDTLSEPGLAVGTPVYMSPEQAAAGASLDGRSDQYSLACVVYEMLVGEPPHTGPTVQAILARQQMGTPRPIRVVRPSVPEEVERAVLRALEKTPADRFGSVADFAQALTAGGTGTHPARRSPRWWSGMLGLALLLTVMAAVWLIRRTVRASTDGAADPTRLAVLYFDDLSEQGTLRTLADGLTEDLIDALGQVPAIRVVSPNGVRAYAGKQVPPDSIGRALGVGTLVGGSVQRSGDVLRVAVRLIDAGEGHQLQSRTLEYRYTDLFSLQDELAQEVSRFLRERLGQEVLLRERRKGTKSVAAWELMREGESSRQIARTLAVQGDPAAAGRSLDAADSMLAAAAALDPEWPDPLVLRAWVAADRMQRSDPGQGDSVRVWFRVGVGHADRALQVRPQDPSAYEARGTLRYRHWLATGTDSSEIRRAEEDLRAGAAPTNPSQARAWGTLSALLQATGQLAEANVLARRAYEADAFLAVSPQLLFRLYYTSLDLGREDEAGRWCETGARRFPEDWQFTYCRLTILSRPGISAPPRNADATAARAWELLAQLERLSSVEERAAYLPRWQIRVASALGRAGLADSADAVIRRARAAAPNDPEMNFLEAEARMLLGDREAALRLVARDLEANPRFREYVRVYPVFRPLWSDPRFQALVREPDQP
jgi:serine/threonine-protein kinase